MKVGTATARSITIVVWNRAQAVSDGRWRTLDSRALHPWVVALSELHVGLVEDLMTQRFGVAWQQTTAIAGRVAKREIEGVGPDLVAEFSRPTLAIEALITKKVAEAEKVKGRALSDDEMGVIHRQAWRETRQKKAHRSLAEMTGEWAERARPWVGDQPTSWVASLAGRSDLPVLRSDDLTQAVLADVARAAMAARSESTSVFTPANIYADMERQLHGVLFAPGERAQVAERAVELALGMAVKLTPPELSHVPQRFRAPDGTNQFAPAHTWQYSTADLLAAEARLLDAGRDSSGPVASYGTVAQICEQPLPGRDYALGADQAVAVEQIATSGRVSDLLLGPAGTGKSTTLAGLRAVWEAEHGAGSVKGLAPSASAAATLADELGMATENTAKWLAELDRETSRLAEAQRLQALAERLPVALSGPLTERVAELEAEIGRWQLKPGELVVVDEASLAGTFALDRLSTQARHAGAKVLLVGDFAQLGAVGAGGAFSMLVEDREMPAELSEVHRFHEPWEKQASTGLQAGSASAIDAYLRHGRVAGGDRDEMLAACYRGWKADVEAGQDRFVVTATDQDGSMTVRRLDGEGQVVLPAGYVAGHVELGYATSAHGAQGQTVGTAHALVSSAMTREALYVAATRARESNRLYVDVEPQPPGAEMDHGRPEVLDARDVLVAIAARKGAERSAHQARAVAWEKATSFEQLVREHQSLVAADSAPRWEAVLERSGLPADVLAQLRRSGEWDDLLGTMRTAAEVGADVEAVLARLVTAPRTGGEQDEAARLRRGLQRSAQAIGRGPRKQVDMVAGLVPRAGQLDDRDMARAVAEREDAIVRRARDLAEAAVRTGANWAKPFGVPPSRPVVAEAWRDRLSVIAAYRDRWSITTGSTLGDMADIGSFAQAAHRNRARQAVEEASQLAGFWPQTPGTGHSDPGVGAQTGVDI
ncbi:MAG: AAA family ATPase [Acidimicrobiales bacterium]